MSENRIDVREIAKKLGLKFKKEHWLELALVHKSHGNENRADFPPDQRDNERLEFVGDAVLDLVVSEMLFEQYKEVPEGELSKMRAGLVNERTLAEISMSLGLGNYLMLGKGEENTGGREKESILASTLEALIAAVYFDGGYAAADKWIRKIFTGRVIDERTDSVHGDYKTRLQEVVQGRFKSAPRYEVVGTEGPDHEKTFEIQLLINDTVAATATGKSKKEAEQEAAKIALSQLEASTS